MSFILSTSCGYAAGVSADNLRGNFSGQIYRALFPEDDTTGSSKRIFLPPACSTVGRRPSGANYGNRQYLVGGHSANILIDEDFRCNRQGMAAPNVVPSVSVGAGTTLQICYTRFYDEVTGERSPLSDGKTVTGDTTRVWTALPTEVPNERLIVEGTVTFAGATLTGVKTNFGELRPGDRIALATALTRWAQVRSIASQTSMIIDDAGIVGAGVSIVAKPYSRASHVEQWISVSGALPRLATRVRIGTTSITESVATLALGLAETESFEAMPRGELSLFYGDRQFIAGVDGHRDHVYLSAVGFPERWLGLAFVTAYNEPIVGMFRYRDYVVLLCPDSSYKLQGYTEDDYVRTVLEPDIGGLGHHGNRVAEGRAFVPGRKGVQIFNGAFHPALETRRTEWSKAYRSAKVAFEGGYAVVNPNDETYQFSPLTEWLEYTTGANGETIPGTPTAAAASVWVGDYSAVQPDSSGSLASPEWESDSPITPDAIDGAHYFTTAAAYLVKPGEKVGKLYRGNNKGKIFVETDAAAWTGESVIVLAHMLFGDPGGTDQEGKKLIRTWSYLNTNKHNPAVSVGKIRIWAGDELAYPLDIARFITPLLAPTAILTPAYTGDIFGTAKTAAGVGVTLHYPPQIVHTHIIEKPGKGFSIEYRFTNPDGIEFIGVGGVWGPGGSARNVSYSEPSG